MGQRMLKTSCWHGLLFWIISHIFSRPLPIHLYSSLRSPWAVSIPPGFSEAHRSSVRTPLPSINHTNLHFLDITMFAGFNPILMKYNCIEPSYMGYKDFWNRESPFCCMLLSPFCIISIKLNKSFLLNAIVNGNAMVHRYYVNLNIFVPFTCYC